MGRLTADPSLKATNSGISVCSFNIAIQRPYASEGKPTADFIPCVAWKKTAENICKFFHKGTQIIVQGSMQSRSYKDAEGKNRNVIECNVDKFYFTGDKKQNESAGTSTFTETMQPVEDDDEIPY